MGTGGLATATPGHRLPARPGPRRHTHSRGALMSAVRRCDLRPPGTHLSAELTPCGEGMGSGPGPRGFTLPTVLRGAASRTQQVPTLLGCR